MTPEPTLSSLAEACAKELHPHPDGTITKIQYDALMGKRRHVASVVLRHLQPLAKDREEKDRWMDQHWHDWQNYISTDSDGWMYRIGSDGWMEANSFHRALEGAMKFKPLTPKPASSS